MLRRNLPLQLNGTTYLPMVGSDYKSAFNQTNTTSLIGLNASQSQSQSQPYAPKQTKFYGAPSSLSSSHPDTRMKNHQSSKQTTAAAATKSVQFDLRPDHSNSSTSFSSHRHKSGKDKGYETDDSDSTINGSNATKHRQRHRPNTNRLPSKQGRKSHHGIGSDGTVGREHSDHGTCKCHHVHGNHSGSEPSSDDSLAHSHRHGFGSGSSSGQSKNSRLVDDEDHRRHYHRQKHQQKDGHFDNHSYDKSFANSSAPADLYADRFEGFINGSTNCHKSYERHSRG